MLLGVSCDSEKDVVEQHRGSRETPVILVSIDTLRADRLPVYGYGKVETPNLDLFRRDGILFRNAFSHSPLTLPSHAVMLTGLLPAATGIRDNIGYILRKDATTLPEMLKKNGYESGGAVSSYTLRQETGISRGFDAYFDEIDVPFLDAGLGRLQRPGAETIEAANGWIRTRSAKPFFFFLHLYEPHTPYEPPEPYSSRYADKYDGEIAHTDALLGDFFKFLKETGVYDRALIIVTSDHGEGLNDHGEEEHGIFLYREAIHVPLLIKLPKQSRAGEEIRQPVQLADLAPTILQATATASQPAELTGSSLLNRKLENRVVYSETFYPRFHFGWSELHSVVDGDYHYIHAPKPELYHLASDPAEKKNLAGTERRRLVGMRRTVESRIVEAEEPSEIDPEQAAKLAALGYVGRASSQSDGKPLPDPKDEIHLFSKIKQAFNTFQNEKYEQALREFEVLLERNPLLLDVWEAKARALQRLGRREEAIRVSKAALESSPRSTNFAVSIAVMSMELGKLEDAERHAELATSSFPAQAHDLLARIALLRGDLPKAEREATAALAAKPDRAQTLVTLGTIQMLRGNCESALPHLSKAGLELIQRKKQPIPGLHFMRGDCLARLGYEAEAERAFRLEMKLTPSDPRAYRGLMFLYLAQERKQDADALARYFVRTVPTARAYAIVADAMRVAGQENAARHWVTEGLRKHPRNGTLVKIARGERLPQPGQQVSSQ